MSDERGRTTGATREVPRELAGRYQLQQVIGSGGAGVVWRAYDGALDREVAVKLLHPNLSHDGDTVERFRREAVAAAALNHVNAVVIHDIGSEDDRVYLVMELVEGPTVADLVRSHGPLPPDAVAAIGQQVADALAVAHDRGLVHRDIKPANVLLTPDGTAKVVDFGIAKALGDAQTRLTTPGAVVGTVAYLSPEQLTGDEVDPRSDIYSLGLVLFECLTGVQPFDRDTAPAVAAARLASDAPSPRTVSEHVPAPLDEVIARSTRRDPDARFADAAAFAQALIDVRQGLDAADLATVVASVTDRADDGGVTRELTDLPETQMIGTPGASNGDSGAATRRIDRADDDIEEPAVDQAAPRQVGTSPDEAGADTHDAEGAEAGAPTARGADTTGDDRGAYTAEITGAGTAAGTATAGDDDAEPSSRAQGGPSAPAPAGEPVGVREDRANRRGLVLVLAAVVIAVTALAGILSVTDGGDGGGGGEQGDDGGDGQPAPVAIAGATDFDPFGGGSEHSDDVPNAFDGDPATVWDTEHYNSRDFGGLKQGVGLVFDLGDPRAIGRVAVAVPTAGLSFELYALGDQPSGDAGSWGEPVATVEETSGGTVEITPEQPVEGRYWLLWLTRLPPSGGHQAEIAEVAFLEG